MKEIHPTAIISASAKIADNVKVGAYAIIEDNVEIGAGSVIEPHARLCEGAIIGENCAICSFSTIAGLPQDLHFNKATKSFVKIGKGTVVREGSTIHRATIEGKSTILGDNCFLMANSHVAHDCVLKDNIIMAPFSALGGFVEVGEDTFLSSSALVQQKCRVGCGAILGGHTTASIDAPPYVITFDRNNVGGLNLVGLNRRKVSREAISNLKILYHKVFAQESANLKANAQDALNKGLATTKEGEIFLRFFADAPDGKRFMRPVSKSND